MYLIGRPWMPPLSFTHLKYALAIFAIVVKSTPGISMLIVPILIGAPVAFLPLPSPHTAFFADAVPDPTLAGAWPAPVAQVASSNATTLPAASAAAAVSFLDLIPSSFDPPLGWQLCAGTVRVNRSAGQPLVQAPSERGIYAICHRSDVR